MEERENNMPQEIVHWYIPKQGEEVVEYYVQENPLPGGIKKETPKKGKKKRGWLIFAIIMAVLIAGVVVAAILFPKETLEEKQDALENDDDEHVSSIITIDTNEKVRIKKYKPKETFAIKRQAATGEELTAQEIFELVDAATVVVVGNDSASSHLGTGIIVSEDGYIITNTHVLAGTNEAWVSLSDGRAFECELVGYDNDKDICVLHCVDASDLPCVEIGDSDECRVGDTVYAIGTPLGTKLRGTFTSGIISALDRTITIDGVSMTFIQTDTALNNGNSGGPLINSHGQVIGINTLKMSGDGGFNTATVEGLGFAIPSYYFEKITNDILATGEYQGFPVLGISVLEVELDDGKTILEVYTVEEGFGGEEAGIQEGDIVLKVDGKEVSSAKDVLNIRNQKAIGDTLTLTIFRDNQTFDVNVKLYSDK